MQARHRLIGADDRIRVTDFSLVGRSAADGAPANSVEAARGDPAALAMGDSVSDSASALELTLTRTGTLLGTPSYMAPEHFACHPVDGRTDQFSYCVALYEALCGERPFAGKSLRELVTRVSEGQLLRILSDGETRIPTLQRGVGLEHSPHRQLVNGMSRSSRPLPLAN